MNIEATLWHPVAALADLRAAPVAARLLEHDLVLWRDTSGDVHAWADQCPHRGTRLSLGRIDGDVLECAYHGWRFAQGGRCIAIPALPGFAPPAAHAAHAHPARCAFGLLWVQLQPAGASIPALDAVPGRQIVSGPFDVATSAPRVIENFLDTAHFAFVHEGSLGARGHTEVPHYDVTTGASGAPIVPHYRAWQPRSGASADAGAWVDYRYEVLGPYTALLMKQAEARPAQAAPREAYAIWACPVDPEHTRVWFTQFTDDTTQTDAALRDFQTEIFRQDQAIVESQRPRRLPLDPGAEAHSAADRLSVAYRRYLAASGVTFGVCRGRDP